MLAGEVILLAVVGLAFIALVTLLRRERITRAADVGESMYPLRLGFTEAAPSSSSYWWRSR
jgi:hypothetical protein